MSRFIGQPKSHRRGSELTAEARLSPRADPYLLDYRLGQEFSFPFVMGLEALAQAARELLGEPGPFELEDVELVRPIMVGNGGTTIRTSGFRRGDEVRVTIRCDTTRFRTDHFRGVVRLSTTARPGRMATAAQELALSAARSGSCRGVVAEAGICDHVLVHGATSSAVEAYLLIGAQRCAARLHCYPARWFAQELPQLQVLGTPALWNSMIHAVQVCVPDVPLSPTRIGRIQLAPHLVETARVTMAAVELAQDGGRHVYEVSAIDETGAMVAAIEGLEFTAAAPAVEPDAWPPELAGPVLQRRLLQLVAERIQVAVVRDLVHQVDDSGSRRVPTRREASRRALSVAMGRPVDLRYRDDGRPDTAGEAISVSHTASMTLAVTCAVPIGCDMEEVRERTFAAWSDILGMSGVALAEMVGVATNEPFAHAATRVWSAREAVSKLGVTVLRPRLSPDSELIGDGWLALRHGSDPVWTTAMAVDDGQESRTMVFAFAQKG